MNKVQTKIMFKPRIRGFTIIETLVAISILMIAVAGPLVVASKGLNSALYARDQIVATYLAQESMEIIKNTRDNNLIFDPPQDWLYGISDAGNPCNDSATPCDVGVLYGRLSSCLPAGCQLYLGENGYTNESPTPTIFSRSYYLSNPALASHDLCLVGSPVTECTVNVKVTWKEGRVPYEVDLSSELVNVIR